MGFMELLLNLSPQLVLIWEVWKASLEWVFFPPPLHCSSFSWIAGSHWNSEDNGGNPSAQARFVIYHSEVQHPQYSLSAPTTTIDLSSLCGIYSNVVLQLSQDICYRQLVIVRSMNCRHWLLVCFITGKRERSEETFTIDLFAEPLQDSIC